MKALLVIPCYYESKRLPRFLLKLCELVESSDLSIEIQLVDDGSSQKEQKALFDLSQKLKPQYSFLMEPLLLAENLGKGGAVRAGWRKGADASTLAFVDADGAASAEETIRFLGIIEASEAQNRVFIATRDSKAGRDLKRKWSRKIVAKVFNRLIRIRYDIQVSDTQCGLKAIPGEFFRSTKDKMVQDGYAFDLEILLTAKRHGLELASIPIDWTEIPGSSTNLRHAWTFMKQILFRKI
jgi:hypothetical protein